MFDKFDTSKALRKNVTTYHKGPTSYQLHLPRGPVDPPEAEPAAPLSARALQSMAAPPEPEEPEEPEEAEAHCEVSWQVHVIT